MFHVLTVFPVLSGVLVLFSVFVSDVVTSIAPGDDDVLCTREPYAHSQSPDERILFDSYNYRSLFNDVWKHLDIDGEGEGWAEYGGVCRKSIQVCDFKNTSQQDNWVFTQYISYPSSFANEIFVRITYDFSKCRDTPSCGITFFNVLHYHANSQSSQEQMKVSNYELIERVDQPALVDEAVVILSFERPSSYGLYIAVQDVGSCGGISRIEVYYEHCPSKVIGLVIYPTLPFPTRKSLSASEGTAMCAPNARNTTLLEFRAFTDGECERTVICKCLPGYVEQQLLVSGTNLLISECKACGPGKYRSDMEDSCKVCPPNSKSLFAASAECPCLSGYFRTPTEGAGTGCTAPPKRCRGVGVVIATATVITITWDKPELTGRDDFYYMIYYKQLSSINDSAAVTYVNNSNPIEYRFDGLQPSTEYKFRITVHNGVSNQDLLNEESRTCETIASTADIDEPKNVSGFCKVITWSHSLSFGIDPRLGYVVRLFIPGTEREVIIKRVTKESYHIIQDSERPMAEIEMYFVQVRFTIGSIDGPWSEIVPLGCDNIAQVGAIRDPVKPTVLYAQDGFIIWSATDTQSSGSAFEIRYNQSDSQNFDVLSVNSTLLAYALKNLTSDVMFTVEVREVTEGLVGNWSLPFPFQTKSRQLTIIDQPRSYNSQLGDDIELTCTARGTPPLSFIWGTTANVSSAGLPPSLETSNTDGSVTSTLYIMNVGKQYIGEYLCIIMDSTGSRLLSVSANITVDLLTEDPPGLSRTRISFTHNNYVFNESDGFAVVGISKQGNISEPFSIHLSGGSNGTKNLVTSIEDISQTLTLNNHSPTLVVVIIPFMNDSVALEDTEVVQLRMELASPVTEDVELVEPTLAVISLFDYTLVSVGFRMSTVSVTEGVGSVSICIAKSAETVIPITVSVDCRPLTAKSGTDYIISQEQVEVILEKTKSQECLSVQVVDDALEEDEETFQLLITNFNPVDSRIQLYQTTAVITIIDDDIVSGLRFSIGNRTYPNNSAISVWDIGENDNALACITDHTQCCAALPHRQGEFYYPSGDRVLTLGSGDGIYRNRGSQAIHLNRKNGVNSPTGRFRCELPDASGVQQSVFINISQTIIAFEETSYTFSEDVGVGTVCLERSGYIQGTNDVKVSGVLQEGMGLMVNETLSFLPSENLKCINIAIDDDEVALERTQELTLRLEFAGSQRYLLGDISTTLVQVIDDDDLSLSLGKLYNVSEDVGKVDICIQFSTQFVEPFEIFINTSSTGSMPLAQLGVDYNLPSSFIVNSDHSSKGEACFNLTVIDDGLAEADECILVSVVASKLKTSVSDFMCITDNDGVQVSFQKPMYVFLESQGMVEVCVEKFGFTQETIKVTVTGALQRGSGQTLNQTLTFTTSDSIHCFDFVTLDDNVGLEETEFLTFILEQVDATSSQRFRLGQYNKTSVGILDDDELVVTLEKGENFTEGNGNAEICLNFNIQFVSSFILHLSTIISPNITIPHRATPDIDYAALPLTLSPGLEDGRNGRMCYSFEIFDDDLIEPDECISITVDASLDTLMIAENGTTTILCITDDDQDIVVGFSQMVYSVAESGSEVRLSVSVLSGDIKRHSSVLVSTKSETALGLDDFGIITNKELQFRPGITSLLISIPIVNDDIVEGMETFSAVLKSTAAGVALAPNESSVIIFDDDVLIRFEHINYVVSESIGQAMVAVSVVDGNLTRNVSVFVSTSDETAKSTVDYVKITSFRQQLGPDELKSVIAVGIIDDNVEESEENFTMSLSTSSPGVNISPANTVITILDDDGQDVLIGFDQLAYTVEESEGAIELIINVAGSSRNPLSISYATVNDTAVDGPGGDYHQVSGIVTVSPSETHIVVTIQIISDNLLEGDEKFSVRITSSGEGVTVHPSIAEVIIVDSSIVEVQFEQSHYSVQESDGQIEVCLTLDGMALFPISLQITSSETNPTDAEAGSDFMATSLDVVIQPLTSQTCTEFTVINDNLAEAQTETFMVTFSTSSDLKVGSNSIANVSIIDSYGGDLYFMLNGRRISYNSNTTVNIRDIGTGDNALLCVTDRENCCSGANRFGEWYYPDGRRVNIQSAGEAFYRNRGSRVVRLNKASNTVTPTGHYSCEILDANGITQTIFINVTARLQEEWYLAPGSAGNRIDQQVPATLHHHGHQRQYH